jgi:hypothetical protein
MKNVFFLSILVVLSVAACRNNDPETNVPAVNIMPEDTMKTFFVDLFLTESLIRQKEREGRNVSWYSNHYYDLMLEKYKMDTTRIINSYQYYAQRPEVLKSISDKALDSLIVLETHLQASPN